MSKLGITLPAFALVSLVEPAYEPRRYSPKTYDRRIGEPDRITNMEQAWLAQVAAAAGCVGVSQTFTSTGTFTANCTGTLTMEAWGGGAASGPQVGALAGSGGGAFAETTTIAVTNGQKWLAGVSPGATTSAAPGKISFICPTAIGACVSTLSVCSGTSLTSANFVCADHGTVGTGGTAGNGGATANSVGVTLFKGGNGSLAPGTGYGSGGGGAGPDGAGVNGATGPGNSGGAGDNGSGGAGGSNATAGAHPSNGVANVLGGGGGGGGYPFGGGYYGGSGGAPGGGGGGYFKSGTQGAGARGQVIVHSMLDPSTEDAMRGYSPGNVGTVSMS